MKRILLLLLICSGLLAESQVYNNEWIDYSKTYYKFKVGSTGVFRISRATLDSVGLGTTAAENFQLWRNGQEIPLYTSVAAGALGGSDYIEFWGEMNDGKPDKQLYIDPDFQLNDHWSLQTDTAFYFLTVNPTGANRRLSPTANNVATNTLSPEPYFMHKIGNYFKNRINLGRGQLVQFTYVYSSAYDKGEGLTSSDIDSAGKLSTTYSNLHVYGAGPDADFQINAAGNAGGPSNTRSFEVRINGTSILQQTMDYFNYAKAQAPFPISVLSSGSATVEVINQAASHPDRMVVAQYELKYPRQFDFDNLKNFVFELPANISGNYLEISNFNYGSVAPVLYDLTNGKRYVADITNPAVIKIALEPSAVDRRLVLVSEDPSNINSANLLQTRNFINYGLPDKQGDYLIISSPVLYKASDGSNPVEDFRAYRSSVTGGSYNVKIYDIDQLIDQFAFGIKNHPSSVKNFIQYALNNFGTPPKYVFLVGKGVHYLHYRTYESSTNQTVKSNLEKLSLVPTFGYPASDNLLSCFNGDNIPKVPIGRLSVINGDEIEVYLKKLKEYEQTQAYSSPYIADKAWMKNVVHVVGASDAYLQSILDPLMANYKGIIVDTLFGANVNTFSKTSTESVQLLSSQRLQNLFQQGLSLITYFGHSSTTSFEFNLDDPTSYNNFGKYPIFITLGCNAGNLYNFDQNRLLTKESISENFVLTPDRGAIAFMATTSLGVVQYLDIVNTNNYISLSRTKYGSSIGDIMREAVKRSFDITSQFDFFGRVHCEQISLNGDPAIKFNNHPKPDYVIEPQLIRVSPSFISVADASFKIDAQMLNMGRAIDSNIVIEVKRTYPNNVTEVIKRIAIRGIRYIDSISLDIPIIANRDQGLNKITITIDADNKVDELYETNNSVTKDVFIYGEDIRPIYPYNFSIVNKQDIKLVASTANPFAPSMQYNLELDTTELFNSPIKTTKSITSIGGVISFDPGVTFSDSTVYYWRVAPNPTSGEPKWNVFSFIYLQNGEAGFNQSHLFQHFKSNKEDISLDSSSRDWKFGTSFQNIFVRQGSWVTSSGQELDFSLSINSGPPDIHNACWFQSLIFNVFDPVTFKPWVNTTQPTGRGLYGSEPVCSFPGRQNNFEYRWNLDSIRKNAMDFMRNAIPDGAYVVVRSFLLDSVAFPGFASMIRYARDWAADTAIYGSGQSLYHSLKNAGFSDVDSFYRQRNFALVYKKNDPSFIPKWVFTAGTYDNVTLSADCITPDTVGYITSPVFGPAKAWKQLHWRGNSIDTTAGDNPVVEVYGIDQNGNEDLLLDNLNESLQDVDISNINATAYPYIKLRMRNMDSVYHTPYQLNYWRVNYDPVPEGAIAPNITFQMRDTVELGEPVDFKIAFKNVSDIPFDSLKVKMIITDKNNVANSIVLPRQKPLPPDSVLTISTTLNTNSFSGLNNLYINVNPDFDQPEQYLLNNFAYKNFYVRPDSLNPLMDVTFDGIHILNRDIVSTKPHIMVKLKDEAKWATLSDTSLFTIKVRFPDGSLHSYYFNSDTMRFTPASPAPNPNNTATVDFLPYFNEDGDYELIVTGKDASNNQAGSVQYKVGFRIFNKPMISNILNYPNPFTTSTAFVFTITGSEVPQNLKIEILTITGKIVREITKDELGPLHIGRNITQFKWDGTDQYGDKLANGIYLYRVVTNLNGKSLDKFKDENDNTDKYFNKGYGKMYLIR